MVGPLAFRFKHFTGCLASPRLSLVSSMLRTCTAHSHATLAQMAELATSMEI